MDAIKKIEAKLDFLLSLKELHTEEEAILELKLKLLSEFEETVDQFIRVDHWKDIHHLKWLCIKENLWKLWDAVSYVPRKIMEFMLYVHQFYWA